MNTCVTFTSDIFTPFLPEESQVNPGCYGAELSWWLSRELAKKNIFTSYPNYEDWGWFLEYTIDDSEFWICCGNNSGEKNEWQIFINRHAKGFFIRKKPEIEMIKEVLEMLNLILEETNGITNIKWRKEV